MRYFIDLAYDGTAYHGWQIQENALGIQQVVNDAFSKILGEPVDVTASGRTDKGVHATHQVIHLDTEIDLLKPEIKTKLNAVLPWSITVKSINRVIPQAHARFDATGRSYEYRISTKKNPFARGFSYFYFGMPDLGEMNKAAALLVTGEGTFENFASFSKVKTDVYTFNCSVTQAYWEKYQQGAFNEMLIFHISANRFLRGMVRAIVGTLMEVGKGKMTVDTFEKIFKSCDRNQAGASMPAAGLFLTDVKYKNEIFHV